MNSGFPARSILVGRHTSRDAPQQVFARAKALADEDRQLVTSVWLHSRERIDENSVGGREKIACESDRILIGDRETL
jgi:hypothetical protein